MNKNIGVKYVFLLRFLNLIAAGAFSLVVAIKSTPECQGVIFGIFGLIALQYVFDFGGSQALIQIAAHLSSKHDHNNIINLINIVNRLYLYKSFAFFILVYTLGVFNLIKYKDSIDLTLETWILVMIANAIIFNLNPHIAIYEGLGYIKTISIFKIVSSLIGYFISILMLINNYGVISIVSIPLTQMISLLLMKYRINSKLKTRYRERRAVNVDIKWKVDIFPFQWKIGLSWICGYVTQQLTAPILLFKLNAIEAGKFGLMLAISNAIVMLSMSWIGNRSKRYVKLINSNNINKLNKYFIYDLKVSFIIVLLLIFFMNLILYMLNIMNFSIVTRLPGLEIILIYSLSVVVSIFIYCVSIYLRSFRDDPMLVMTFVTGTLFLLGTYIFSSYGTKIIVILILIINVLICLPWTFIIFQKNKRKSI